MRVLQKLIWLAISISTSARAEQIIFVDPKFDFFIVDPMPTSFPVANGDALCILDQNGLFKTCEAYALHVGQRIAIYMRRDVMREQKIAVNGIIRLKNAFLISQELKDEDAGSYTFVPAAMAMNESNRKLAEQAKRQEELLAKFLPLTPEAQALRNEALKKRPAAAPPATAGIQSIRTGEPLKGTVAGKDASLPYDGDLMQFLKKVEESMTKVPDLSKVKMGLDSLVGETEEAKKKREEEAAAAERARKKRNQGPWSYSQVQFLRIQQIISPVSYKLLEFKSIEDQQTTADTLWKTELNNPPALSGSGGQLALVGRNNKVYQFGGRSRTHLPYTVKSRLFSLSSQNIIINEVSLSSYGFWLDYGQRFDLTSWTDAIASIGVDWDSSELSFDSLRLNQTNTTDQGIIAFASSGLNIYSLRLNYDQRIFLGKLGITAGVTATVPLWSPTPVLIGKITPPEGLTLSQDAVKDLTKAAAHQSNSFGIDVIISLIYKL